MTLHLERTNTSTAQRSEEKEEEMKRRDMILQVLIGGIPTHVGGHWHVNWEP